MLGVGAKCWASVNRRPGVIKAALCVIILFCFELEAQLRGRQNMDQSTLNVRYFFQIRKEWKILLLAVWAHRSHRWTRYPGIH